MARKLFPGRKHYLSLTCTNEEDKALRERFVDRCKSEGISLRQGLLRAVRDYLYPHHD